MITTEQPQSAPTTLYSAVLPHNPLAEEFFFKVLELNFREVFLTEDTQLQDFTFCGGNAGFLRDTQLGERQAQTYWDEWVLERIDEEYGVAFSTTAISIDVVLAQIEAAQQTLSWLH